MFCPKCGAQIPEEANFCIKCGYNVRRGKRIKKTTNKKEVIIGLIIIAGLLIYCFKTNLKVIHKCFITWKPFSKSQSVKGKTRKDTKTLKSDTINLGEYNRTLEAECQTCLHTIRAALAAYYAKTYHEKGYGEFPRSLHSTTFTTFAFASGTLPKHPFGRDWDDYYDPTTGVVSNNACDIESYKIHYTKYEQTEKHKESQEEIFQKITKSINPMHPTVRNFAVQLAEKFPGSYNTGQVVAIYEYLRHNWKYVNDPRGFEYFAPANESIENGLGGDCDDFAILMATLIEAIGGSTRVVFSYKLKGEGHAYAEVFIGKSKHEANQIIKNLVDIIDFYAKNESILYEFLSWFEPRYYEIHYHKDSDGCWLNLDWWAEHPGGPFFGGDYEIAIYPNGQWRQIK